MTARELDYQAGEIATYKGRPVLITSKLTAKQKDEAFHDFFFRWALANRAATEAGFLTKEFES